MEAGRPVRRLCSPGGQKGLRISRGLVVGGDDSGMLWKVRRDQGRRLWFQSEWGVDDCGIPRPGKPVQGGEMSTILEAPATQSSLHVSCTVLASIITSTVSHTITSILLGNQSRPSSQPFSSLRPSRFSFLIAYAVSVYT